jgi:hypothetical protein
MSAIRFNTKNLMVLTDSGFRPFVGVAVMDPSAQTYKYSFDNNQSIDVTTNHRFMMEINDQRIPVHASVLNVGDLVCTSSGGLAAVVSIEPSTVQAVYDLIEVGDNQYYTDGILSHNCEFLSSDPLLIDSMILAQLKLKTRQPIREDMGFKFYQELQPGKIYLLGVDPATGTGEDHTTMQVYDLHDLTPVAEFRSNTMSSSLAYANLKLILNKISAMKSTCYFSIENNGVGEGMIALYENDEVFPENVDFVSEEGSNRMGMRTESRIKLRTCLQLKQMIESEKIKVWSETLLEELESFSTSTKGSYAAQVGATDDLISGLLIIIRLLEEMATYDQKAFDTFHHYQKVGKFKEDATDEDYLDDSEYDDNYEPDSFIC